MHLVIIGGGITGLAAARAAALQAPDASITLLEASDRLGGKIRTVREDGFIVEGGPESYLAAKQWMTDLCADLGLGDQLETTRPENRGSRVLWRGQLYPIPDGLSGLIPTRMMPVVRSPLLSPLGKLRMGLDWVLPARRDAEDESLASFVSRRFGRQAYERMIEPLMAGIYAGDGGRLSTLATFPQLRAAERQHGGIIRGMIAAQKRAQRQNAALRAGFLTPRDGTATIVEALAGDLTRRGVTLRTGALVRSITWDRDPTDPIRIELECGEWLGADGVIVTTSADVAARLIAGGDGNRFRQAAVNLRQIPQVNSVTLSLAFRRSDIPDALRGYGYVVPHVQQRPVLASTWTSSKWANRAPDDAVLLRFYIGRAGGRDGLDLPDEDLVAIARQELREVLRIDADPIRHWVFRWPGGSPQYTVGHLDRVAEIEQSLTSVPGLALAGCSYHGVGIPDCVRSGERAAWQVIPDIARKAAS